MEQEESTPLLNSTITEQEISSATPILEEEDDEKVSHYPRSVRTKVPEVEFHIYRQGKGPIAVSKSVLVGRGQDQLDVRDILEKYGFKCIYAFNPNDGGRAVPIRFHPLNGRSMLSYKDGSVIFIDGEPKDSMIKPVTRIIIGVAIITVFIAIVAVESPQWAEKLSLKGVRIPPWILICAFIVFVRMRKRTSDFFKSRDWC